MYIYVVFVAEFYLDMFGYILYDISGSIAYKTLIRHCTIG